MGPAKMYNEGKIVDLLAGLWSMDPAGAMISGKGNAYPHRGAILATGYGTLFAMQTGNYGLVRGTFRNSGLAMALAHDLA
ncbi:hypothetical protein N7522_012658 [Penicillium canescens]|uniref:Uncharacterized protein n=1 Tax=Penicillium canescens TaxID=5083 RepID=A0AAD6HZK4_PENCN|nr:uncharacterized protein N7446_013290 [Penicillium canescens]KAJ5985462.1 hypothetical protein N7522_012658 [Penicillium canescens]KAJ6022936.1 hypothetical protein N7460_013331 [Penicillium canescens]KAJ6025802.1 hypothetical protein N7444_013481 [Penicillium canescens]KAJ6042224.1 hypothetical protein N7446_013290 [Penicillium canescens]